MCLVWKENGIGFSSFGFQNNSHRVLHGYTFFHPKPNRVFLSNPDPNRTRIGAPGPEPTRVSSNHLFFKIYLNF